MKEKFQELYQSLGRYRALYLLSALELVIIISWVLYTDVVGNTDKYSYYEAYDVIMSGHIDQVRTPLYPLIIGIPKSIFGLKISLAIVFIIQSLVFLFSIKWFGKTLEKITSYKKINYWCTAIYALYPGPLSFCGLIITESLSISLVTALIYLVSGAYYGNSFKKAAYSGLLCLVLWLLRPALIPVTIIMTGFWICLMIFKGKEMRKTAICGLCATLISLAGIGIYAMMFYKAFNKVGLTCVTTWNNYHLILEAGVRNTDLVEDPEIKATIDSIIEENDKLEISAHARNWEEGLMLNEALGVCEFDKYINQQIKRHPGEIISYLYHDRLESLLDDDCVSTGYPEAMPFHLASLTRIIRVNNGTAFLIILTGMAVLLYADIKRRRMSYFIWLLYSFCIANYFTLWLGAMFDFSRLTLPFYPVLLAVSCWLSGMLVYYATDDRKEKP